MFCQSCGKQLSEDAQICPVCGKPVSWSIQDPVVKTPAIVTREPGRGTTIMVLGILSLVLLGPILGLPAWVMGSKDLKKIRAGLIAPSEKSQTKVGMILGIVSTAFFTVVLGVIIVGIAIAVGISMVSSSAVTANRDAVVNDLNNLASKAQQYWRKPAEMGGGNRSFANFYLDARDTGNANGSYSLFASAPTGVIYVLGNSAPITGATTELYIIGCGKETGNDPAGPVKVYSRVTPGSVWSHVLN